MASYYDNGMFEKHDKQMLRKKRKIFLKAKSGVDVKFPF